MNKTITLTDKVVSKDKVSLVHDTHKKFRTQVIGMNEFGEVLFEEENDLMLGGAIFLLEKMFGVRSPLKVESLNNIMNTADDFEDELDTEPISADNTVCLFGVGTGGAGESFGDVKEVNPREREIINMVPFRVTDTELTPGEKDKYWFSRPMNDGNTAYYLKRFEQDPIIRTLWRDGDDDQDGSTVQEGVHASDRSDGIESFVELQLKIGRKDLREFFDKNGNIDATLFNSLGLFTGEKREFDEGRVEFANVKLFSKLNLNNESFTVDKELTIKYRIYAL